MARPELRYQGLPTDFWIEQSHDLAADTRIQALNALRVLAKRSVPARKRLCALLADDDASVKAAAIGCVVTECSGLTRLETIRLLRALNRNIESIEQYVPNTPFHFGIGHAFSQHSKVVAAAVTELRQSRLHADRALALWVERHVLGGPPVISVVAELGRSVEAGDSLTALQAFESLEDRSWRSGRSDRIRGAVIGALAHPGVAVRMRAAMWIVERCLPENGLAALPEHVRTSLSEALHLSCNRSDAGQVLRVAAAIAKGCREDVTRIEWLRKCMLARAGKSSLHSAALNVALSGPPFVDEPDSTALVDASNVFVARVAREIRMRLAEDELLEDTEDGNGARSPAAVFIFNTLPEIADQLTALRSEPVSARGMEAIFQVFKELSRYGRHLLAATLVRLAGPLELPEKIREQARPFGAGLPSRTSTADVFAYGSNMSKEQMRERCPSAVHLGVGALPGYRVVFDKLSKDGSGKANVIPSTEPGASVWGALWRISREDLASLDKYEGGGYRRANRAFGYSYPAPGDHQFQCASVGEVYEATESSRRAGLTPSKEYLARIVEGAIEAGLDHKYVEGLRHASD